jgi:hypothetical protein
MTQIIEPLPMTALAQQLQVPTLEEVAAQPYDATREIARLEAQVKAFEAHQRFGALYAAAGFGRGDKNSCTVIIELGASMGFSAAESLMGIYLVNGIPAVGAHLRAARMKAAGYDWEFTQQDEKACVIELKFRGRKIGTCSFTWAEAERMKTKIDGKPAPLTAKDNWQNSPSDMLYARCITRAQRRYAPHVLNPNLADYTSGESFDLLQVAEESMEPQNIEAASKRAGERLKAKLESQRIEKAAAEEVSANA